MPHPGILSKITYGSVRVKALANGYAQESLHIAMDGRTNIREAHG